MYGLDAPAKFPTFITPRPWPVCPIFLALRCPLGPNT